MTLLVDLGGELAALTAACLWAVASVVYSAVGVHVPPRELNLIKGVLALAMLGLTLLAGRDAIPSSEALALGLLLLSGAIGIGLGDTAYFEALSHLGARRTLLLGMLAPPMAALLALVILRESLSLAAWLGILATVLGVTWVVTERVPGSSEVPGHLKRGVAFGSLAALAQASGAVLSHAALVQTSISPLLGASLRMAAGVLMLVVWMALARQPVGRWLKAGRSNQLWGRLLFAVLTGTYLAVWLQQVALKHTSAGVAQTLLATSPLFVLPFAAWKGERITARAVVGVVVALSGIGLLFGLGI